MTITHHTFASRSASPIAAYISLVIAFIFSGRLIVSSPCADLVLNLVHLRLQASMAPRYQNPIL